MALGFGAPQDWYPENDDRIDATKQLYDVLESIVQRGFQLELLDCWSGNEDHEAIKLDVSLSRIGSDQFRMFEGYLFALVP